MKLTGRSSVIDSPPVSLPLHPLPILPIRLTISDNSSHTEAIEAVILPKPHSLSSKVVKSGLWVFALRLVNRGLGLLRKILLARLLAPEDFGLFGIALLSISTLETFSKIGFQGALIQKKGNIDPYLNTAWTAYAIRGLLLCIILFLAAPKIAEFFNSPQAILLIRLISLSTLFAGFKNIGIIFFQKELEFSKQFLYEFSSTLVNFLVAISLAFLFRNVFALVWGTLAGAVLRLCLSYILHPYRPRIELKKEKYAEIFGFGSWTVVSGILIFLVTQGDDIVVGKLLGATALGLYQMAYLLSNLPATEIAHVLNQVAFPAFSKLNQDLSKLKEAYLKLLHINIFMALPITMLIFVLAFDFTNIFLGSKWLDIVPAIKVLALAGLIRSIAATGGTLFFAIGKPKIDTILQACRFAIIAILIYPLCIKWGLLGISLSVLLSIIISGLGFICMALRLTGCDFITLLRVIVFPTLNTLLTMTSMLFLGNCIGSGLWQFLLMSIYAISIYFLINSVFEKYFRNHSQPLIKQMLAELITNRR